MASSTLVSGVLEAKQRAGDIIERFGRAQLNAQFPNDFEYYLCALELVNANNENDVLEYFVFPVMPSNISIQNTKLKNITKTSGGTVVLENNTFIPNDVQISGNFGRKLRTLSASSNSANPATSSLPFSLSTQNVKEVLDKVGLGNVAIPSFSVNAKTGYGATKLLENIFNRASEVKDDAPVKLFFYNFAFNSNDLVEPISFVVSQSEQNNMIWEYQMNFKIIAPANQLMSDSKYKQTLSKFVRQDNIQKGIQSVLDFTKNQSSILQNQLFQKIGDGLKLDDNLNKLPQLTRTLLNPF